MAVTMIVNIRKKVEEKGMEGKESEERKRGARELGYRDGRREGRERKGTMKRKDEEGTETGTGQTPEHHREDRTMDRRQPVKLAEQWCPRRTRRECILA